MAILEALMILLPLVTWLVWRRIAPAHWQPSGALLLGIGLAVLMLAGFGIWTRLSRDGDTTSIYVPSRMGADGQIEPSRMVPTP